MDHSENTFVTDLMFTVAFIAKIVVTIVLSVKGILTPKVVFIIIGCILGLIVPMGFTILFVVCKLTHVLSLGWGWIVLPIVLDGMMIPTYAKLKDR